MIEKIEIITNINKAYNEQYDKDMYEWRMISAKYKSANIFDLCNNIKFQKVLEVGAGEGSILQYLNDSEFCYNLYALEISRSGLENILNRKMKYLKEALLFNGYDIPYDDNTFDLVILSHVLEHVEYPRILLREIKRVSLYTVIEIPIDFRRNVDMNFTHFLNYGHINIFLPTLLRFLLKSEGFNIIKDKMTITDLEIIKYINKNNSIHKKIIHVLKFYRRKFIYHLLPKTLKEFKSDAYTVLTNNVGVPLESFLKNI